MGLVLLFHAAARGERGNDVAEAVRAEALGLLGFISLGLGFRF